MYKRQNPNTVIEFDFDSKTEGEIHGIGFDNDSRASNDRIFKVHGSQDWGILDYDNQYVGGSRSFTIPVGQFYTGNFDRLVLACDDDAGRAGTAIFKNIKVYERASLTEARWAMDYIIANQRVGQGDDEVAKARQDLQASPNPVDRYLFLRGEGFDPSETYQVLNSMGVKVMQAQGDRLDTQGLKPGVYIIQTKGNSAVRFIKR